MKRDALDPLIVTGRSPRRPWLWIGLPMLIGTALVAAVIAMVVTGGFGSTRTWADVSLIIVLLPMLGIGLLPMVLLIGLSYGIGRLVGWLPDPMGQAARYMRRVARATRKAGNVLVKPVLTLRGAAASVETFLRGIAEFIG